MVVHRVEATSRLSPVPEPGITTSSPAATTALGKATVSECTVYTHDEETFSESTLEQRTTFDQTRETYEQRHTGLEVQEEEIVEQVYKALFTNNGRNTKYNNVK